MLAIVKLTSEYETAVLVQARCNKSVLVPMQAFAVCKSTGVTRHAIKQHWHEVWRHKDSIKQQLVVDTNGVPPAWTAAPCKGCAGRS